MTHTCTPTDAAPAFQDSLFDAKKLLYVALVLLLPSFFSPARAICGQAEPSLAILDAGVEKSEDAPFVSEEYRFFPGDYLYFRFQVGGFAIQSDEVKEIRSISLAYEVSLQDQKGVLLAEAVSGEISSELSPEDKNWTPKRRVSFLLPSFVAAGAFRVHVVVKDLKAHTETARDIPFRLGGVSIVSSSSINVQNFHFFRGEDGKESLEVAAYRPGDTVYARFDMAGYQLASGNKYHLAYGLTVLKPDGKPFVQEPKAAELASESFYPAPFVPGDINVITARDSPKGIYIVLLTVRDQAANQAYQFKSNFTLE